jgi:hypothetical protein
MKRIVRLIGIWFVLIMFLAVSGKSYSEEIDFRYIDSVTYHLYINQSWDSLIDIGKKAIRNHIDYYYLRVRMADAYNAREQYILSAQSFEKALAFNQADPYASEGLYYAYLKAGKISRAYQLSAKFNENLKKRMGISLKTIDFLDVFGGYVFSNNMAINESIELLSPQTNDGKQTLYGDEQYVHAGLLFNVTPSFRFYTGVNYIGIDKKNRFEYKVLKTEKLPPVQGTGGWVNYRYETVPVSDDQSFDGCIKQYELYLNAALVLEKAWTVSLFSNLLYINTPVVAQQRTQINMTDTLRFHPTTGHVIWTNYPEGSVDFIQKDSSFMNWVAGFELQKDFGLASLGLSATYSELSGAKQAQLGISCFYYPLGSTKLYGQTALTGFFESNGVLGDDQRLLFHQMIGVKLFPETWLEAELLSGNLNNANIKQASVTYNLPEKINFIAGIKLHIFATEKLEINLLYNYSDKNGFYSNQDVNNSEFNTFTFSYYSQSIIGGLKWTF